MEVATERLHLHNALLAQRYARVAVEKLSPEGDIDFTNPAVPRELEQAFRGATEKTNWHEIAKRFALLPQMEGRHFDNLYLRVDSDRLKLVVVTRFGTSPLQPPDLQRTVDYAWPIIENTGDLLETFPLSQPVQDAATQLVKAYLGAGDPATQAAASLLNAALQFRHNAPPGLNHRCDGTAPCCAGAITNHGRPADRAAEGQNASAASSRRHCDDGAADARPRVSPRALNGVRLPLFVGSWPLRIHDPCHDSTQGEPPEALRQPLSAASALETARASRSCPSALG
jgi:hypothetical protein